MSLYTVGFIFCATSFLLATIGLSDYSKPLFLIGFCIGLIGLALSLFNSNNLGSDRIERLLHRLGMSGFLIAAGSLLASNYLDVGDWAESLIKIGGVMFVISFVALVFRKFFTSADEN